MAESVGSIGPLVLVLCINGMLLIAQVTMDAMASESNETGRVFYSDNGSVICQVGQCDAAGVPTGLRQNVVGNLPLAQSGTPSGGGTFTDLWNTMWGWVKGAGGFLLGMVAAPVIFLWRIGLTGPVLGSFAFIIGTIWSGFSILVIVNFIRGS